MARAEWFKYLKLAFDELACEYPAYLTKKGIVFSPSEDEPVVDCVDRELLSATITMNADQVPLIPMSKLQKQEKRERLISLQSIVSAINSYQVSETQQSWDYSQSFDRRPSICFYYLTWDDVIDCLLIASE